MGRVVMQFLELTAPSSPASACSSPCCSRRPSPHRAPATELPIPLLDLLSNSLILHQVAPYLPISAVFALSRTNTRFYRLLLRSAETFRYLDLSRCASLSSGADLQMAPVDRGGTNWRSQRMDEALTEDDFYSGPLRGVFNCLASPRNDVLRNVTTLVLDGLTVTADLVSDILVGDKFNVRILSIREVKHLNERKLRQALWYAVRPGRPEGTPKLKGLYVFGQKEKAALPPAAPAAPAPNTRRWGTSACHGGVVNAQGAQL
ncbi:MAG: hypothetical protein INR71_04720, partial [Terriglobus roseus]|nr:hypothetical protein [Terriglobus roseus]